MLLSRGVLLIGWNSELTSSSSLGTEDAIDIESWFESALWKSATAGDNSLTLPIDLAFGCGPAVD